MWRSALILLTNARTLLKSGDVGDPVRFAVYAAILVVTAIGLHIAAQRGRRCHDGGGAPKRSARLTLRGSAGLVGFSGRWAMELSQAQRPER